MINSGGMPRDFEISGTNLSNSPTFRINLRLTILRHVEQYKINKQ